MDYNCRPPQGCNPGQFPNIPRLPASQSHTHCHHLKGQLCMTHTYSLWLIHGFSCSYGTDIYVPRSRDVCWLDKIYIVNPSMFHMRKCQTVDGPKGYVIDSQHSTLLHAACTHLCLQHRNQTWVGHLCWSSNHCLLSARCHSCHSYKRNRDQHMIYLNHRHSHCYLDLHLPSNSSEVDL